MSTTSSPPSFVPTTTTLKSLRDSRITSVSLYASRAEIIRVFNFSLATPGHHQLKVVDLPSVLESDTLRVEGHGAATIHDVAVKFATNEILPTSSEKLDELNGQRDEVSDALSRCEQSIATLKQYLGSLTVEHLPVGDLDDVLTRCDATAARLDARKKKLKTELIRIDNEMAEENERIKVPQDDEKLRMTASIGIFAEEAGEVEIVLIYAVPNATWRAFYNIRVDMSTKESLSAVKLIYKAAVTQNTGEPWDNVPLQLETSTPTFGLALPTLHPWNVSVRQPPVWTPSSSFSPDLSGAAPASAIASPTRNDVARGGRGWGGAAPSKKRTMSVAHTNVSSQGNVTASFQVPGLVSIPCDGQAHNFTIVELDLKAAMSWVSIPKVDPKAHLSARVVNASEYTLLSGDASIYVDGSFISRSRVPPVSPHESFDCPLGLDPSVRITYHPILKARKESAGLAFLSNKLVTHTFSQRITVHNTKTVALSRLKVVDQIPNSQDAQIEVKLVNPALTLLDGKSTLGGSGGTSRKPQLLSLGNGVSAQWDGADEANVDPESLGLEGKLNWVCEVPAQQKINLSLEWEVAAPVNTSIVGL
ncbi:hypothetical protein HMN09_00589800 [Mycena chlorophos]|uniref:Mucoidy inhibitor A n=1 Tax=Mycena chlorophos TaxID=658473 RepID=A0A8H6T410_MYCCL|nr:hypothetical protein HMN09_00589800 [Mycena chlorophos]